jgi:hypothetical protein
MTGVVATSAVPFLAAAGVVVLAASCWQLRSLLRSLQRSSPAPEIGDAQCFVLRRCGFRVRSPEVLAVSFPLASMTMTADFLALSGPLGEFTFRKVDRPNLMVRSRTPFSRLGRLEISTERLQATVYVRETGAVVAALNAMSWKLES